MFKEDSGIINNCFNLKITTASIYKPFPVPANIKLLILKCSEQILLLALKNNGSDPEF